MPLFSPYANHGYAALIKEVDATPGTPVTPTGYFRFTNESVIPDFAISPVQEISGGRERNVRSIPNKVEIAGDIEFFIEPKMIGHFLRSLFGSPTTQILTASVAFRHSFTVSNTPRTFTLDIQPANAPWVHRFYGVQIGKLAFEPDENKIKCTATLAPRKAFISARVTTAVAAGTSLVVDQVAGLVVGDSILVMSKETGHTTLETHLIAGITPTTLTITTTAAIAVQLDVNDVVVIKRATTNYDQGKVLTWHGGSVVSTGVDIDNLTATDRENFSLEYTNETEPRFYGGKEETARYPGDILTKGFLANGVLSRFYDNQLNLDKLRKNIDFALRVKIESETATEANALAKAKTYWGTGNGFSVEAATGGVAGNDYNVTITIAADDTLAASVSGKNVLVQLANTTAAKNTGTLIAAAVNALAGVDSVVEGTGAEEFTVAVDNQNLGDSITGATVAVVGRDASEKPYLQFDHAAANLDAYFPSAAEDGILQEDLPMTFYKDVESGDQSKKWSVKIRLVNSLSAY